MERYVALFLMSIIPVLWAETSQVTTKLQTVHPSENMPMSQGPVTQSAESAVTDDPPSPNPMLPQLMQWLETTEPAMQSTTQHTVKHSSESSTIEASETGVTQPGSTYNLGTDESHVPTPTDSIQSETTQRTSTELPVLSPDLLQWLETIHRKQNAYPIPTQVPGEHSKRIADNLVNKHENTFDGVSSNAKSFIKVREYFSATSHSSTDELPSANEFFKWLDSIQPRNVNVDHQVDVEPTESSQHATEIPSRNFISTKKSIILSAVVSGTFLLFVIIFGTIYCRRQKKSIEINVQDVGYSAEKVVPCIYQINNDCDCDNTFMGIPANNNIWKELQMLSATAPVVLPASEKI